MPKRLCSLGDVLDDIAPCFVHVCFICLNHSFVFKYISFFCERIGMTAGIVWCGSFGSMRLSWFLIGHDVRVLSDNLA